MGLSKFPSSISISVSNFVFFVLCIIPFQKSNAQIARTDPSEVRALNSIFQQWDVRIPDNLWNISGEPCTGTALGPDADFGNDDKYLVNPAIICDCTFDNNTTCHITRLKIWRLSRQGVFLEELAALTYLIELRLDKNSFTGTLPSFVGNFSALQVLQVAHNQFYGPIPREIGNLKQLYMLALSSNNFSGSLPPELGNLVNLRLLYLDSCGAGGEIPSTFANLQNLVDMWAPDNSFSGKLPAFIGNWRKLDRLRLYGNNFEGPIPASFSNLTSLRDLRIGDLQNFSSSLDFVTGLTNLTNLVIRNALVSGPIPTDIFRLDKLITLDLSFNNISGPLPPTLANMSSLVSLFLGNNSLSGSLLPDKSERLQNLDLSYNQLSGNFPPWVRPTSEIDNLQLNLVANNFKFDSTNISVLPGLDCLQRDFPCNRNTTPYSGFAIKCGGPETRADNGILFENENLTTLGPASFYLAQDKWGVSNVGITIDNENPSFIASTTMPVNNTTYPELFTTSRKSPSSLRYYGLGLKNGPYTVTLYFAETVFNQTGNTTWQGHPRRVFDIYIQGNRRQKDFDISMEAGGFGRALIKEFDVNVTQSFLEIHLFWAGKGTCCIPQQGDYGPLISALKVSAGLVNGLERSSGTHFDSKAKYSNLLLLALFYLLSMLILFI